MSECKNCKWWARYDINNDEENTWGVCTRPAHRGSKLNMVGPMWAEIETHQSFGCVQFKAEDARTH